MNVLNSIEKQALRDLLGKGWLTHDGMWFLHTCQEFGIEKANVLNRAAIKSMAPFEVERMKKLLGINQETFVTRDELISFLLTALEVTLPESVFKHLQLTRSAENSIRWSWENRQCFAYKGMKQIGMIDGYQCGVIYRIECWLEALGVPHSLQPEIKGCLMHEKGTCQGKFCIEIPARKT